MKTFLKVLTVGVLVLCANGAQADWGHTHGVPYGYGAPGGCGYYGGCTPYPHYHWHDTGHYDYYPPTVYPHGDHYHVNPGYYQWHGTGHWHPHW